jgi:hypothetical protein
LDFDSMLKFLTFINMPFVSIAHAYVYEVIWPWKWLCLKLPCPTNHNANMHSLDLSCLYLQFDQIKGAIFSEQLYLKHNISNSKVQIIHRKN